MVSSIPAGIPSDWLQHVAHREVNIYYGDNETLIPQEYLILNSIELTESICDNKFHLGGVIASRFKFSVNYDCIPFGNDKLKVVEHITLDDNSEYDVPLGKYTIDRTDSVITEREQSFEGKYVAYDDFFGKTDKVITAEDAEYWYEFAEEYNLTNLIAFVTAKTGVRMSETDYAIIGALENNTAKPNYSEGEAAGYNLDKAAQMNATYRDLLSSIAALCGGAFKMRRSNSALTAFNFIPFQLTQGTAIDHILRPNERISSDIDNQPGRPVVTEITFDKITVTNPLTYPVNTSLSLSLGDNVLLPLPEEYVRPEVQSQTVRQVITNISKQLGNWDQQSGSYVSTGDPLVLITANVTCFGDPTIEAGDYIRSTTNSGVSVKFFVMENVYRFRQPSMLKSYGDANNAVYTSSYNPSYGDTKRPSGYNAATTKHMADISQKVANSETEIQQITQTVVNSTSYSTLEHKVGTWIDGSYLYERTYVASDISSGAVLPLGITNLSEIVESRGQVIDGSSSEPFDDYSTDRTDLTVGVGSGKVYITLRYTLRDPIIGYILSQSAYDALTEKEEIYYAILDSQSSEAEVSGVVELTQAEYDAMSTHVADELYIIKANDEITNVMIGDEEISALYYGSLLLWQRSAGNLWIGAMVQNAFWNGNTYIENYHPGYCANPTIITVKPNTTYRFSFTAQSGAATDLHTIIINGSGWVAAGNSSWGTTDNPITFTTPTNANLHFTMRDGFGSIDASKITDIVLEEVNL